MRHSKFNGLVFGETTKNSRKMRPPTSVPCPALSGGRHVKLCELAKRRIMCYLHG